MRWLALTVVGCLIGSGIYLARRQLPGLASPPAKPTSGIGAETADTRLRIFAGGTVEGMQREISLKFEIAGRLSDVLVKAGDRVTKGDVLAQLDPELSELKFREARTLLKLARAERDQLVNRAGNVRQDDLTVAEAKVELAEGALRRERIMLEKTALAAPIDGVILRVLAEPGELVGPNDVRELLILVNHDRTRIRAYVEELDALKVSVGQKAVVTADGDPDKPYPGIVRSCSPCVAPKSHRHLKPGEFADIRVREVLIDLVGGADLLIGLPVDVFIEPGLPARGDSVPVDDGAKRSSNPQPIDALTRLGRSSRQTIDPNVRSAGHQDGTARRR